VQPVSRQGEVDPFEFRQAGHSDEEVPVEGIPERTVNRADRRYISPEEGRGLQDGVAHAQRRARPVRIERDRAGYGALGIDESTGPGHDLGTGVHHLPHGGGDNVGRQVHIVRIEPGQHIATGHGKSLGNCVRLAPVRLGRPSKVWSVERLEDPHRGVSRSPIDDDVLNLCVVLHGDGAERRSQKGGLVQGRRDDRHERGGVARLGSAERRSWPRGPRQPERGHHRVGPLGDTSHLRVAQCGRKHETVSPSSPVVAMSIDGTAGNADHPWASRRP
jgi:hypothetical protein